MLHLFPKEPASTVIPPPSNKPSGEEAGVILRRRDEADLPLHLGLHAGDVPREKDPDGRDNVS
jgi:hypothetical protein